MTSIATSKLPLTRQLNILLADDSRVNQKIAQIILQEMGSYVTIASNGEEAVGAADSNSFDLILMDVEMPKLDGFEATARIRAREKTRGRHTPIIAMTAHSTPEYRERCIAAGMDGYIAKPLSHSGLEEAVRAACQNGKSEIASQNGLTPAEPSAFDREEFLERICHDHSLLVQVSGLLVQDVSPKLEELKSALERKDSTALAKTAHALKGMVGNFSAHSAYQAAEAIEVLGRSGSWSNVPELTCQLEKQIDLLEAQLLVLIQETVL